MIAAVLDHLWQSTLFLLGAGLLTLVLRDNGAQARYCLWFAASVKFLLPFSLLVTLGSHLIVPSALSALSIAAGYPATYNVEQFARPFADGVSGLVVPAPNSFILLSALFVLWGMGSTAVLLLWLARWRRINRALRFAKPLPFATSAPVKSSQSILEPGLVGIWRPVLLLPEGITERLSPDEMRSIIAHELCHLRRCDNLTAAIHMLVETLFWFYPPIWWLGARLIEERERACDEAVLDSGNDPKIYAESILKVCRFYLQSPIACAAGVSGANLKKRMEAIINSRAAVRLSATKKILLAVTGAVAFAIPVAAGVSMSPAAKASESRAYCINANADFYPYRGGICEAGYQLAGGNCRAPNGDLLATSRDKCQQKGGTVLLPFPSSLVFPPGDKGPLPNVIIPRR